MAVQQLLSPVDVPQECNNWSFNHLFTQWFNKVQSFTKPCFTRLSLNYSQQKNCNLKENKKKKEPAHHSCTQSGAISWFLNTSELMKTISSRCEVPLCTVQGWGTLPWDFTLMQHILTNIKLHNIIHYSIYIKPFPCRNGSPYEIGSFKLLNLY